MALAAYNVQLITLVSACSSGTCPVLAKTLVFCVGVVCNTPQAEIEMIAALGV